MPLSGTGMLITIMDIAPEMDADFHRWYDREHFPERVAIEGFLEARRYVAVAGQPKYLHLYTTKTFDVLDSPAYRLALNNQTEWSLRHIPKFRNPIRVCGRVGASKGQGRGCAVALFRLRPAVPPEVLREALTARFEVLRQDGIISFTLSRATPSSRASLFPTRMTPVRAIGTW